MLQECEYHALVVDDEPAIRMLTMRELSRNGFACHAASNGRDASELVGRNRYDVVVTDLQMPTMNGHALAVELLGQPNRPIVVVLTGGTEPRLAKDLLSRGVEDILFKPIDQSILALKIRALVERRAALASVNPSSQLALPEAGVETVRQVALPDSPELQRIQTVDLDAKLRHLANAIPISQAALDVINMTSLDTFDTLQLTAAIKLDPSFAAELLRIANSSHYNPRSRKIIALEEAVVRVGHKRTGQLALAMSTMGALTASILPWINMDLTWRRSVAAGAALDLLLAQPECSQTENGLFLGAIMHPLGTVVLATLYPDRYQEMLRFSQKNQVPLQICERRVFGVAPAAVMAKLLATWNIPSTITEPLQYIQDSPVAVSQLTEPLRTRVELIQTAVSIARIAVGNWEEWDLAEFPLNETLRRLKVKSPIEIIRQTRQALEALCRRAEGSGSDNSRSSQEKKPELMLRELRYCNGSNASFDFMSEFLPSIGIKPIACSPADLKSGGSAIINGLGVPNAELPNPQFTESSCIRLTDEDNHSWRQSDGTTVTLPFSVGAIRSAILGLSK